MAFPKSSNSPKKVLFVSNGHGEDLNASEVLKALKAKYPHIQVAALPMVGEGNAYRKLGVEIIAPTLSLPSGGFVYMDKRQLLKDVNKGLLRLTWNQITAAKAFTQDCDLVFATGDIVPLAIARLTNIPYQFLSIASSAHYENRLRLPFLVNWFMRSPLCKVIFTRDRFTAQLLNDQGITKATFEGCPFMDALESSGELSGIDLKLDLQLHSEIPTIALIPGSRLPAQGFAPNPIQFRAALVPSMISPEILQAIAQKHDWSFEFPNKLIKNHLEVICYDNAFADILYKCDLVIGMAGTAVEQAVGLGKPVIQIIGEGPQFTYPFAEAQMRLLGKSVQTIGKISATDYILQAAAHQIKHTLQDSNYLQSCKQNALERVGLKGASMRIADQVAKALA
jgi:uncharacterized protein (TIGR03492 family)